MSAPVYNIVIDQGADFVLQLEYLNPDQVTPINITGWSAKMMIRQTYSDTTPLLTLTSAEDGGIILGGTAGTITVDIPAAQTASLPAMVGCYDMKIFDTSGDTDRFIQGTATVTPAVTQ